MPIEIPSFDIDIYLTMELQTFMRSLEQDHPPAVGPMLTALWYDGKGDWDRAHYIVQDSSEIMASRIHAYLHRKEGDLGNAGYWYSRAGKNRPSCDLETEWQDLVEELISK